MTHIIIPIKTLARAKQRLAAVLSGPERVRLVLAMLADVLAAAVRSGCGPVLVVASDAEVFDLARRFGAGPVREAEACGYNPAVALGLAAAGPGNAAILPGDVPLALADEIAALAAPADPSGRTLRIAPSRDRAGTNGLFLASGRLMPPAFGPDSFACHRRAAAARGIAPTLVEVPGLAFDIDTPRDLCRLAQEGGAQGATARFLAGLGGRLEGSDLDRGIA
ncbi:MAG: 2-phospho-L-lactate guanylyltransferase [Rhodobacteraceae bacterium]|nr:2-phospho-L-lactate guanylyltransferase [Paracoccaceae bacterium]